MTRIQRSGDLDRSPERTGRRDAVGPESGESVRGVSLKWAPSAHHGSARCGPCFLYHSRDTTWENAIHLRIACLCRDRSMERAGCARVENRWRRSMAAVFPVIALLCSCGASASESASSTDDPTRTVFSVSSAGFPRRHRPGRDRFPARLGWRRAGRTACGRRWVRIGTAIRVAIRAAIPAWLEPPGHRDSAAQGAAGPAPAPAPYPHPGPALRRFRHGRPAGPDGDRLRASAPSPQRDSMASLPGARLMNRQNHELERLGKRLGKGSAAGGRAAARLYCLGLVDSRAGPDSILLFRTPGPGPGSRSVVRASPFCSAFRPGHGVLSSQVFHRARISCHVTTD